MQGKIVRKTFRAEPEIIRELEAIAKRDKVSLSEAIRRSVQVGIERRKAVASERPAT